VSSSDPRDPGDDRATVRVIALRYTGACGVCRTALEPKTRAGYRSSDRMVICLSCLEPPADPDAPANSSAGASARREYERRRNAREQRIRERFPRTGGVVVAPAGEPQHQRAWQRGAEGEERLGRRLEQLAGDSGVRFLHDRRIPGSRANIDHLAIGPSGVTVIDAKRYRGKIELRRGGGLLSARVERLFVGGRDRTSLVDGLRGQVAAVRRVLAAAGAAELDVTAVLCFVDVDGLPLVSRLAIDEIAIEGPRRAARRAARPGPLAGDAVERIRATLAAALPPA
jgi:hypothetical protein